MKKFDIQYLDVKDPWRDIYHGAYFEWDDDLIQAVADESKEM